MAQFDGNDFEVVTDLTTEGVRRVVAQTSRLVCSQLVSIEIKDGILQEVTFVSGCEGNLKGIGALVKGMSVKEVVHRLSGITCGMKPTSCPDQLSRILASL